MWPTSTLLLVPALQSPACFNRSSAMWPTSTKTFQVEPPGPVWFQSLKRDVAYFHMDSCELLRDSYPPFQSLKRDVAYFHGELASKLAPVIVCFNRSSAMWPTSTPRVAQAAGHHHFVSIAQARCG